ncbi:embryonic protein UVS.2 isoform X3 [Xenopus tropicalis]|uniref:Metalloendopeptidase n=1 Tax=Xenopus tropicalis TaxID=8364 RepID=A0A8J0SU37_XENTR|nr:embryonic protein UVS.2 isoform X3 [Xenopus tropicalis]|eukprot:XP_012824645.1 PREDICTED: embryonic protein UVS.2-like isoform X3 [Xenopus tropicalis]
MSLRISIILLTCVIESVWSFPAQVTMPALADGITASKEILEENKKSGPGNMALTEGGDILINIGRSATSSDYLWPKSADGTVVVPYIFSYNYSADELTLFKTAMQEFETLTCVRFVPKTIQRDFLNIVSNGGCLSMVGRNGGGQKVELASYGCMSRGVIQHELNHALGFYHEHMRSDRDDYVTIITENIIPSYENYFSKRKTNNMGIIYDYNSVMHYSRNTFSISPDKSTIVPKPDPSIPIGQRDGLSILDILKIKKLYQCDVCAILLPDDNGTLTSANYPSIYPNNASCVWLIRNPSGQVTLQFNIFDIQSSPGCVSDYIKIYDGPSKTSPVLVDRACGTGLIPILIASTNQMLVEFVSDGAVTGAGFKATYGSVQCGGAFYASNKTFTTPGYPGNYYSDLDCTWTITAPTGYKVSLQIKDFYLEIGIFCIYDYLYIYNSTLSNVMGPYCGPIIFYDPFLSTGNVMTLKFHSDINKETKGFSATYTFVPEKKGIGKKEETNATAPALYIKYA